MPFEPRRSNIPAAVEYPRGVRLMPAPALRYRFDSIGWRPATRSRAPVPGITDRVAALVESSISDNTRRAYQCDLAHFDAWGGHA